MKNLHRTIRWRPWRVLVMFLIIGCVLGSQSGLNPLMAMDTDEQSEAGEPRTGLHADAGEDITVEEGHLIDLDGSGSYDTASSIISYTWMQTGGPPVRLFNWSYTGVSLFAPPVDEPGIELTFTLEVENTLGDTDSDDVVVTILDNGISGFPADALTVTTFSGDALGIRIIRGGTITGFQTLHPDTFFNPDLAQQPGDFIFGLIQLSLITDAVGDTVNFMLLLPDSISLDDHWYVYGADLEWMDATELIVFNSQRDQISVAVTDGGAEDADGQTNGKIQYTAGFGKLVTVPENPDTDTDLPNQPVLYSGDGGGCFVSACLSGLGFWVGWLEPPKNNDQRISVEK